MKCPHCGITISLNTKEVVWPGEFEPHGYGIFYGHCPACECLIVIYRSGEVGEVGPGGSQSLEIVRMKHEEIIYPKGFSRRVEPEVPDRYQKDFSEACAVLTISTKASAALSRRILQDILREQFKLHKDTLAKEIESFIQLKDVPSYLTTAVDAVRIIGNFAAHPLKNTNTGEIVEVAPGEAEWLIEVIESLFDFVFVQPKRLDERRQKLNQKLQLLGKQPMK
jgi:hypothetical protein